MITTAHLISGGVLGELVNSWPMAFLLGFFLHFVLDAVPHFDKLSNGRWTKKQIIFTSIDFLIAFVFIFIVFKIQINKELLTNSFFWGAFGSFLPDLLDNVPFWKKRFRASRLGSKFHYLHDAVHKDQPSIFWGMLTQVIVIIFFTVLYFVIK